MLFLFYGSTFRSCVSHNGMETGLAQKHACLENQSAVLKGSGFVSPWMFSCPQQGHVIHFVSVRVPDFPLFSLLSAFAAHHLFLESACIACCFCNQVNKWGTATDSMCIIRPTASRAVLIVWTAGAKNDKEGCVCVRGRLAALCRCDSVALMMSWASVTR